MLGNTCLFIFVDLENCPIHPSIYLSSVWREVSAGHMGCTVFFLHPIPVSLLLIGWLSHELAPNWRTCWSTLPMLGALLPAISLASKAETSSLVFEDYFVVPYFQPPSSLLLAPNWENGRTNTESPLSQDLSHGNCTFFSGVVLMCLIVAHVFRKVTINRS